MKLLDKLEKNKIFWFLLGISLLFFFLRLPSLIEPNWYGDEGIYQVIGIALNNHQQLYSEIWDNKPPLLYVIYGLFQGNQFGVRIFSLFIGMLTLWTFFALTQRLFHQQRSRFIATTFFAFLFSLPLLEGNIANAENFILLPILAGALLVYQFSELQKSQKQYHFILNPQHIMLGGAGFLLGIAFLIKSVAFFDFLAFFLFLLLLVLPDSLRFNRSGVNIFTHYLFNHFILLVGGFFIPFLIALLYFFFQGTLSAFLQAAFIGNISYVGYGNTLFFSYSLLAFKTLLLLLAMFFIFRKRKLFNKPTLFILIWTVFSVFSTFFSQRPYPHYVLVSLPALGLLLGLLFTKNQLKKIFFLTTFFLVICITLITTFRLYDIKRTFLYYQNTVLFLTGQKSTVSYHSFFDTNVPRDYTLASFLKLHTKPNEPIFIWGNSAQIYALSQTLPISKYSVAYHITQQKDGITQTQKAIYQKKPRFIIRLHSAPAFPFQITEYTYLLALDGAVIYERSF